MAVLLVGPLPSLRLFPGVQETGSTVSLLIWHYPKRKALPARP